MVESLYRMGEHNACIQYCQNMIEYFLQSSFDHHTDDLIVWYSSLGCSYKAVYDYDLAIETHYKALELAKDNSALARIYYDIGGAYQGKGDTKKEVNVDKAFEYYLKSLQYIDTNHDTIFKTKLYHNLGLIYLDKNMYNKADMYLQEALNIQLKLLPSGHSYLAATYLSMGKMSLHQREYDQALKYFQLALDTYKKSRLFNHASIRDLYEKIAATYYQKGEYIMALKSYEKILSICHKYSISPNYATMARTYENIVRYVYLKQSDAKSAVFYAEKALEVRLKYLTDEQILIFKSYHLLGLLYSFVYNPDKQIYDEYISLSLENMNKALSILLVIKPINYDYFSSVYHNLGVIHRLVENYKLALECLNKSIEIGLEHNRLPNALASTYDAIAQVYTTIENYDLALSNMDKVLDIFQATLPAADNNIIRVHTTLGSLHKYKKNYLKSMYHFTKAFHLHAMIYTPYRTSSYLKILCRNLDEICRILNSNHSQRSQFSVVAEQEEEKLIRLEHDSDCCHKYLLTFDIK
ncbi:unnamed protein product [Didymodactylos carnosus]|uniref:Uncharacterized protein n=1 Tax=Didymodactylos carnosus TaxID=1234261 RepID=A0A815NU43_9BILA|nr:unnamed protein product [Didymodactylos carnosus]CAF4315334.1 unnamed protein product [Didymodactylos carnosus]